jgi:predicted lipoprotein with Yx(FWY)xxD motif
MQFKSIGFIGAGMLLLAGAVTAAEAPPTPTAKIQTEQQRLVDGAYLTDGQGRSVYMFEADSKGNATCYETCAQAWPPVLTHGSPEPGKGVEKQMLGTIERKDGSTQVTYNGIPLYYFIKDKMPGDINGQDVHGFGADWHLLNPQGQVAHSLGSEKKQG